MCRFHCRDPETCKIPRFSVDLVKEDVVDHRQPKPAAANARFVRNQKVQFFSPPSDSESSSDEEDYFDAGQCILPPTTRSMPTFIQAAGKTIVDNDSFAMSSSSASSSDSGFSELPSDVESKEGTESSSLTSEQSALILKSILVMRKENSEKQMDEQAAEKKRVRFADDCGHLLVRCRSIQSRLIDSLFADLVEIEPADEPMASPWRIALLRKLFATPHPNTTSLLSLGQDEFDENIGPEPVQA